MALNSPIADNWLTEIFLGASSGVFEGLHPLAVPPTGVRRAYNTSFRGGPPKQRPVWLKRTLSFADNYTSSNFNTGYFQTASRYKPDQGNDSLLLFIGGKLFQITLPDYLVRDVSASDANPTYIKDGWIFQGEKYAIVNDGFTPPMIFDGHASVRPKVGQIRCGRCGIYDGARFWYALADGYSFRATDLVGTDSDGNASETEHFRDAILWETENTYLHEGGDFRVPTYLGPIRAFGMPATLDTALGHGPVQVGTVHGMFSVNAPLDRTVWKDVTWPIQTRSQFEYGALADFVSVNGDLFYRSLDGLRSFRVARSDFDSWPNTPISSDMIESMKLDSPNLLHKGSGVLFQNRLLYTFAPFEHQYGVCHRGLVVLDFDGISTMQTKEPPAWQGAWVGLDIHRLVKLDYQDQERCFGICRNPSTDEIELWELQSDAAENYLDNDERRVEWGFETKGFVWRQPERLKRLAQGRVWIEQLKGTLSGKLRWAPDGYRSWIDWGEFSRCATVAECDSWCTDTTRTPKQPDYRPDIKFNRPPSDCLTNTKLLGEDFYRCCFRLELTGHAAIGQAAFHVEPRGMQPYSACPDDASCTTLSACPTNPFSYRADGT